MKEVLASNTAKLVAACVCPVVGAGTVVMEVPQVRAAVHKATAAKPKRHRVARAKAPVREPKETAPDRSDERGVETAALMCSQPIHFADAPLAQLTPAPVALMPMAPPPRIERVYVPSGCGAVPGMVGCGAAVKKVSDSLPM